MAAPRLGRTQLRIMQLLWRKGRATAREITDALSADGRIAHSTVQTLLRKLEDKGAVGHEVEERTFIFHPRVSEQVVTRSTVRDVMSRLFGGSASGLVAYLVKHERLSRDELKAIRRLLNPEGRQ